MLSFSALHSDTPVYVLPVVNLFHAFTDGLRMSRKKALRDVKNTLQVKHTSGKPVGKISTAIKVGPSCNPPAKDLCASATPKEAFKIKCDDNEDDDHSSWNYCNCEKNVDGKSGI